MDTKAKKGRSSQVFRDSRRKEHSSKRSGDKEYGFSQSKKAEVGRKDLEKTKEEIKFCGGFHTRNLMGNLYCAAIAELEESKDVEE